jgi:hypothetical protein
MLIKNLFLFYFLCLINSIPLNGQQLVTARQRKEITSLIDKYSLARETRDTILLKSILTSDIDQLVSTGEWRDGVASSVKGMLRSSANSPGKRKLTVHKIRLIDGNSAIVDCKYDIENADGSARNMWSTFIVVADKGVWKISAIRNMLPSQ